MTTQQQCQLIQKTDTNRKVRIITSVQCYNTVYQQQLKLTITGLVIEAKNMDALLSQQKQNYRQKREILRKEISSNNWGAENHFYGERKLTVLKSDSEYFLKLWSLKRGEISQNISKLEKHYAFVKEQLEQETMKKKASVIIKEHIEPTFGFAHR